MRFHRLVLIAITTCAWNFIGISHAIAQTKKPNILLVVADDLGYTDIGSYGGEIDTPKFGRISTARYKVHRFPCLSELFADPFNVAIRQ